MRVAAIVLAAGAGSRRGEPKALARDPRGSWLERAALLPLEAGCERVIVVLGAAADEAQTLLPDDERIRAVVAEGWRDGLSASLRAGLLAAERDGADAALVTLVDLPSLRREALDRVLAAPVDARTLRQAVYEGRPGHPVLIGAAHWAALREALDGDRGAGRYLRAHGAEAVDCTDLGGGDDVDHGPSSSPSSS